MKNIFRILISIILIGMAEVCHADEVSVPELEYVMEIHAAIGDAISVSDIGDGERIVIPIVGGSFEGIGIRGTVLDGGADYQIVDKKHGRSKMEAIYCLKTDDGEFIRIKNKAVATADYFITSPEFEASFEGKYSRLNNGIYVGRMSGFKDGVISFKIWKVK